MGGRFVEQNLVILCLLVSQDGLVRGDIRESTLVMMLQTLLYLSCICHLGTHE